MTNAVRARRHGVMVVFVALLVGCHEAPDPRPTPAQQSRPIARGSAPAQWLQGDSAGFLVADRPRQFSFPADHGPHPGYRTEWWYLTGRLRTSAAPQRDYGFQFTVFRQAVRPAAPRPAHASAWRADDVYLAHLAVTDIAADAHAATARLARGALGLGGARRQADGALAISVDGWRLTNAVDGVWHARAEGAEDAERATDAVLLGVALQFTPRSPVLLHGEAGLSRKGPSAASYYYSLPRLAAAGRIRFGAQWRDVRGEAWLDREWSTSALAPEQLGWDWFSLQLDDGSELMLFRLRRRDGGKDPYDAGTWRNGAQTRQMRASDFALRPLGHWRDERGRAWPTAWEVLIPSLGLRLEVRAVVQDQLMRVGLEYWEGAVAVTGSRRGHGYLEATGY